MAMWGLLAMCVSVGGPVTFGLFGLFPAEGNSLRYLLLYFFLLVDMLAYLLIAGSLQSMIADVVEHRELISGQREEGTIFAAQTLVLKLSSALGVWVGGGLLELIRFPTGAGAENVSSGTIEELGLIWIGGNIFFYVLAFLALLRFQMTRTDHQDEVDELARRSQGSRE